MERQTDGPEWVLATLFVIAMILVIGAAIREVRRMRAGDPGGDEGGDRPQGRTQGKPTRPS